MIERTIERLFFASRWLIAPVYLGLSLALIVLGIKFFEELFHALMHVNALSEAEVVLSLLALVDLALVAGLIVMVMFSGYENFVSKIDIEGGGDKLGWVCTWLKEPAYGWPTGESGTVRIIAWDWSQPRPGEEELITLTTERLT